MSNADPDGNRENNEVSLRSSISIIGHRSSVFRPFKLVLRT